MRFIQHTTFYFLIMCVYVCICAHQCICSQRPEEGILAPGAGLTGRSEPPGVGAETQTHVLCKNHTCS